MKGGGRHHVMASQRVLSEECVVPRSGGMLMLLVHFCTETPLLFSLSSS